MLLRGLRCVASKARSNLLSNGAGLSSEYFRLTGDCFVGKNTLLATTYLLFPMLGTPKASDVCLYFGRVL
jgi:hypothetical protein